MRAPLSLVLDATFVPPGAAEPCPENTRLQSTANGNGLNLGFLFGRMAIFEPHSRPSPGSLRVRAFHRVESCLARRSARDWVGGVFPERFHPRRPQGQSERARAQTPVDRWIDHHRLPEAGLNEWRQK